MWKTVVYVNYAEAVGAVEAVTYDFCEWDTNCTLGFELSLTWVGL